MSTRIENVEPEPGKQYYLARTHWLDAINPPTKEQICALLKCVKALLPDRVVTQDHVSQQIIPPRTEKIEQKIKQIELPPEDNATIPKKLSTFFDRVVIFDAFNDNTNDWSVGDVDGDWWVGTRLIENGVLNWKGISRRGMFSHQSPRKADLQGSYTDMEVSSWVKLIDPRTDGSFGITLRGTDESNHKFHFYAFLINQDKYHAFMMYTDSKWKTLIDWKINPSLQLSDWNRLTAQAIGSHFRLLINDNLVSEIDDATLISGKAGVIISMNRGAEKIQFQFDDFELRLLSSSV